MAPSGGAHVQEDADLASSLRQLEAAGNCGGKLRRWRAPGGQEVHIRGMRTADPIVSVKPRPP